ncbi:ubiquitinyl hydrolase [Dendrothele bispora CBS 962.96]|uniref:Ubiquitin carboxyl-terminal hydrolase n=1 Tax=Dendrothele bispora (strain CBS 962.96) TaxID=1314807 RepID=A0A4V4HF43_DENBC|nr:ubiquitinyl hydrolase [Dendrothele bispora CBS 962.96]
MSTSTCSHLAQLQSLQPPRLSQLVHRQECTQCFDNQDSPQGIDVCLTCFNGGCLDLERHHAATHVKKSGHTFTLNVKRKLKPSAQRAEDEEPPAKMKKLAIVEEREDDKYEHVTVVKCWKCDPTRGVEIPSASNDPKAKSLIDGIMQSLSSARQSEVKAWEEDILPCEHTLTLEQFATGPIAASGLAHCNACNLKENLWLCLTCGSLGCGRQQFGGVDGNSHGLEHFKETSHPVSVKLGTITPEGGADIYCYSCDDAKLDPELASHLATFGINVQTQTKTEKSMTELQIEHNLKYDFSLTGEDGKALEPLFGSGLTGLRNLGNSCYIASVLQTLFSLAPFQDRYFDMKHIQAHSDTCPELLPADCIECQMIKIADGLLSGRYSYPANYAGTGTTVTTTGSEPTHPPGLADPSAKDNPVFQEGIKPSTFKALIGKGHEEFRTMRQQDSEEFFTHLVQVLRRDGVKFKERGENDPTQVFSYAMEQRLQCIECQKVRYRTDAMDVLSVSVPAQEKGKDGDGKTLYEDVSLWSCIEGLLGTEVLDYSCPGCGDGKKSQVLKQTKFASFPQVLVVHAKKFQLVNWVPAKLDIPLILPENNHLEFGEQQLGQGLQPGEVELPEDKAASTLPQFDEAALAQLEGMGFPLVRCQKALLATGNNNAEAAMEWLFAHMEDPDIDDPIQPSSSGGAGAPEASPEQIAMLSDMGFTPAQAKKALRETGGNPERAVEWLFNHPDDMGEDEAAAPSSGSDSVTSQKIPGSKSLPASYKLKAFISHKGPSVHSGHYVAHVRKGNEWVFFNDEKVVKADEENVRDLKRFAYLYFFERV